MQPFTAKIGVAKVCIKIGNRQNRPVAVIRFVGDILGDKRMQCLWRHTIG